MSRGSPPSIAEQLAAAGVKPSDVRLPGVHGTRTRKERKVSTKTVATEDAVWTWSMFGTMAHAFAENITPDCTGFVSACKRYQRSRLVEPTEEALRCVECVEKALEG